MKHPRWEPFVRSHIQLDRVDPTSKLLEADPADEIWVNNIYQVAVFRTRVPTSANWPKMIQLSIKRRDKKAIHDWRDLQRIKNELVGPEHEAAEIYPAESRLVDTANQYFLWVLDTTETRFPFGFAKRWVNNVSERGLVQRPFPLEEMPPDCKTYSAYLQERNLLPKEAPVVALPPKIPRTLEDVGGKVTEGLFYSVHQFPVDGVPESTETCELLEDKSTENELCLVFKWRDHPLNFKAPRNQDNYVLEWKVSPPK